MTAPSSSWRWSPRGALALLVLFASLAVQAWRTDGIRGPASLVLPTAGLMLALALVWFVFSRRRLRVAALSLGMLAALHWFVGGPTPGLDLVYLMVAAACAWVALWLARRRRRARVSAFPLEDQMSRFALVFWPSLWVLVSVGDPCLQAPLRHPDTPQPPHANRSPWPNTRVSLALSGGGYRAALYHAGVMERLEAWQVPVQGMSTVSGGSIFGSFYATGGSPAAFLEAMEKRRFNLKRELLHLQSVFGLLAALRIPFTHYTCSPSLTSRAPAPRARCWIASILEDGR